LVAFDKNTGDIVWKTAVTGGDAAAYASQIIVTGVGIKQYVQCLQNGLVGGDAKDGKFLWRYSRTAGGRPANIPSPVANDDLIYSAASRSGGGLIRIVETGGEVAAEEVYVRPK